MHFAFTLRSTVDIRDDTLGSLSGNFSILPRGTFRFTVGDVPLN